MAFWSIPCMKDWNFFLLPNDRGSRGWQLWQKFYHWIRFCSFSYRFSGVPPTKRLTAGGVVPPKRIPWTSSSQTTPISWSFHCPSLLRNEPGCGTLCLSFTKSKNNKYIWDNRDIFDIDNNTTTKKQQSDNNYGIYSYCPYIQACTNQIHTCNSVYIPFFPSSENPS